MSITLATGTLLAIASTYGTSVAMSAISNATEAVATLAPGHGAVVGDYLEVTSDWDLLNSRIVRVKTVATNDVTFEGINTTSTTKYPAGTGTGSIRRITAWTNIGQVKGITPSGGEQQFADITTITDRVQKQAPTVRTAQQVSVVLYDDPTLAGQIVIQTTNDNSATAAMRISYSNGSKFVSNGYWSIGAPDITTNQALTAAVSYSAVAQYVRYAT